MLISHLFQMLSRILWSTTCFRSGSLNPPDKHYSPEIVSKALFQMVKYIICWNFDFYGADKGQIKKIKASNNC